MDTERKFLRVPSFDHLQNPKRPKRPHWLKMFVRDLEDPAYLELSPAARGFLGDFQRLAAMMQNRVPYDVKFIARKIDVSAHVVGKLLSTCLQLGHVHEFAEDLKTSKLNDIAAKSATPSIPPSLSNSKSPGGTMLDSTSLPPTFIPKGDCWLCDGGGFIDGVVCEKCAENLPGAY